jgi:hypothetical protein
VGLKFFAACTFILASIKASCAAMTPSVSKASVASFNWRLAALTSVSAIVSWDAA